jgi:hypothetical protein
MCAPWPYTVSAIKSATIRVLRHRHEEHFDMIDVETTVEEANRVTEDADPLFVPEDGDDALNQALSLMEPGFSHTGDLLAKGDPIDDLFGQDEDFDMDEEPLTVQALHGLHKASWSQVPPIPRRQPVLTATCPPQAPYLCLHVQGYYVRELLVTFRSTI